METEKPVFKIKSAEIGAMVNPFRIRPAVHAELKRIAHMHNLPMQELIRQMIDFAIEHMPNEARP